MMGNCETCAYYRGRTVKKLIADAEILARRDRLGAAVLPEPDLRGWCFRYPESIRKHPDNFCGEQRGRDEAELLQRQGHANRGEVESEAPQ